jgi:hypothetical protein
MFDYYSGIIRPTDQEMVAIKEIICHSGFPREGSTPHRATWGSTRVRRWKRGEKTWQESLCWLPWKSKAKN